MTELRRILLDGSAVQVVRHGDTLVAGDGREVAVDDAVHLPPTEPSKIIAALPVLKRVCGFTSSVCWTVGDTLSTWMRFAMNCSAAIVSGMSKPER